MGRLTRTLCGLVAGLALVSCLSKKPEPKHPQPTIDETAFYTNTRVEDTALYKKASRMMSLVGLNYNKGIYAYLFDTNGDRIPEFALGGPWFMVDGKRFRSGDMMFFCDINRLSKMLKSKKRYAIFQQACELHLSDHYKRRTRMLYHAKH